MDFVEPAPEVTTRTPVCTEADCKRNTSPEVLGPLLLGFLQAMTGQNWEVRVRLADVSDVGEMLLVKAEVNMGINKNKFGAAHDPEIVPPEV